ncbi:MAG: hypothetical protein J6U58_04160 [Bacteroidaceae bacterium]|nr:hypothetical protein [Bacteroidaceae bacterium]
MNNTYQVAGHCFTVSGSELCKAVESIDGFAPFRTAGGDVLFSFVEGTDVPKIKQVCYEFTHENVNGKFGRTEHGFILTLEQQGEDTFYLWHNEGDNEVALCGKFSAGLCRFAMWIGLGLMIVPYNTVAIHASCIVYQGKAVLFLGASGTGKSTHTRLWQENFEGAFLLNDDSPFLRVEDGKIWAYGSPWSGKTPCYKQERYELKGCVRLSQAPYNQINKLPILQAYGAIHPSCPPAFAHDEELYDHISNFISCLLSLVPCYHLACLPDKEAATLSFKTIFTDEAM